MSPLKMLSRRRSPARRLGTMLLLAVEAAPLSQLPGIILLLGRYRAACPGWSALLALALHRAQTRRKEGAVHAR